MEESSGFDKRLRELQDSHIETKTYVFTIMEDIKELKVSLKEINDAVRESSDKASGTWQPVVTELIKLVSISIAILGTVAGVIRMAGA